MTALAIIVGAFVGAAIAAFLPARVVPVAVGVALGLVVVGAAVVVLAGSHPVLFAAIAVGAGLTVSGARRHLVA